MQVTCGHDCRAVREIDREEVISDGPDAARLDLEWETPEFDEIGCAAEVTMYVAQLED